MHNMDSDGLLLCQLQAEAFEKSVDETETSSEIFVRRFMHSEVAKTLDNKSILATNLQAKDLLDDIEAEYGVSNYGSVKYTHNEMHWIGYIYRYFSYTYEKSSTQVYRIVKPKELRGLYLPYHTLDAAQAVERILEAKEMLVDETTELQRQFKIFKMIRKK